MNVSIGSADRRDVATRYSGRRLQKRAGRHDCDADAERHDDQGCFGIVARLKRLIPVIKHLQHRSTQARCKDHGDGEPPNGTGHRTIVVCDATPRLPRGCTATDRSLTGEANHWAMTVVIGTGLVSY
jgi:hypothetical protein